MFFILMVYVTNILVVPWVLIAFVHWLLQLQPVILLSALIVDCSACDWYLIAVLAVQPYGDKSGSTGKKHITITSWLTRQLGK